MILRRSIGLKFDNVYHSYLHDSQNRACGPHRFFMAVFAHMLTRELELKIMSSTF